MERPTKIQVIKNKDGYEITCVDEMTGSAVGINIPTEGYEALKHHFKTGDMEISSDDISESVCAHEYGIKDNGDFSCFCGKCGEIL